MVPHPHHLPTLHPTYHTTPITTKPQLHTLIHTEYPHLKTHPTYAKPARPTIIAFTVGTGGFFTGLAGVLGSLVANHIASFVINSLLKWRAQTIIAEILIEIIIQSPSPENPTYPEPPDPTPQYANARYKTWVH